MSGEGREGQDPRLGSGAEWAQRGSRAGTGRRGPWAAFWPAWDAGTPGWPPRPGLPSPSRARSAHSLPSLTWLLPAPRVPETLDAPANAGWMQRAGLVLAPRSHPRPRPQPPALPAPGGARCAGSGVSSRRDPRSQRGAELRPLRVSVPAAAEVVEASVGDPAFRRPRPPLVLTFPVRRAAGGGPAPLRASF